MEKRVLVAVLATAIAGAVAIQDGHTPIRWAAVGSRGRRPRPRSISRANELRRVYDLEHDRFEMRERRNMLFPFLAPFGHSFALNVNVLDGDIAFDVNGFKDHLVLFELGVNTRGQAKAVLDHARTLVAGKPITHLITSHNHFDHTAGVRAAIAEGLTIIARPATGVLFREMAAHPAADFPDDLAKNPKPLKFLLVEEHVRLSDDTQTLDVYWARNNGHMADVVFAYAPAQKVLIEGDMVTAAYDWQHWPDTFRDAIKHYGLDVQQISPVHSVSRDYPGVLTLQQAEELLKGGTERARQHCAAELARGTYWPGCPIQSKYY